MSKHHRVPNKIPRRVIFHIYPNSILNEIKLCVISSWTSLNRARASPFSFYPAGLWPDSEKFGSVHLDRRWEKKIDFFFLDADKRINAICRHAPFNCSIGFIIIFQPHHRGRIIYGRRRDFCLLTFQFAHKAIQSIAANRTHFIPSAAFFETIGRRRRRHSFISIFSLFFFYFAFLLYI